MADGDFGWNERRLLILKDGVKIAAVVTKSLTLNKEAVDVTTDDDDAWRRLLPRPGARSMDCSVEGVATNNNFDNIISLWEGEVFADITLEAPNGDTFEAEDGFFLGNVEVSAAKGGYVSFTATLQSSGPVTRTEAT